MYQYMLFYLHVERFKCVIKTKQNKSENKNKKTTKKTKENKTQKKKQNLT